VRTRLDDIAAGSRRNQGRNDRYCAWLKERSPLSNDALDQWVAQLRAIVEPAIDCIACNHCCRTLQVVVDRRDIARLASRLETTPADFTATHVDTAPDGVQHLRRRPCPFLGPDGACTVYEDRPRACRDYPYLDTPRIRSRSHTMLDNVGHCPIVHNVWELLVQSHPAPMDNTSSAPADPQSRTKPLGKRRPFRPRQT